MYIEEFIHYLKKQRKMAPNTLSAYEGDIKEFLGFLKSRGMEKEERVTKTEIVAYILHLKETGKSSSTINRKMASLRGYFLWMMEQGYCRENPTSEVKSPKIKRKEVEYLTIEQVNALLETPDENTTLGKRDRAILELLYATGIRVNEIILAKVEDVNLRIGFFTCNGDLGKARIIPLGGPAKKALEEYIYHGREALVKGNKEEKALFVNYFGKRMSRQGLWKILKEYGDKSGVEMKITPHILRNSFAVHMVQNGADLKSLQELLGHEDPTATQIYLSVTRNRIKDVYDRTHPRA